MQDFQQLIGAVEEVHHQLQASAANAVNQALTIRNWLIGYYIVEFEQDGADRAQYGAKLLTSMAEQLIHIKGFDERSFRRYRQFYMIYPQLGSAIRGTLSPELPEVAATNQSVPQLKPELQVPADKLLTRLSYSHLELLLNIDEPLKRTFYELEAIKGIWSVRELKRQINTLYFERSGLSANPTQLAALVQ